GGGPHRCLEGAVSGKALQLSGRRALDDLGRPTRHLTVETASRLEHDGAAPALECSLHSLQADKRGRAVGAVTHQPSSLTLALEVAVEALADDRLGQLSPVIPALVGVLVP